jgi:hypothetical protein
LGSRLSGIHSTELESDLVIGLCGLELVTSR